MPNIRSDLYAFQYDIFQRYSLLQRVVSEAFPSTYADKLSILDVGCGASKLSSSFLGESVKITRADVSDFGESDIIVLDPNGPFPFPDQSFDVVMALEVLEHVPQEGRAALIAECRRVARRGVIICCPVADYGAPDAEKVLNETVRALADKDEAFLLEHALFGLPTLAEVRTTLGREGWSVSSVPNAPLDHWLLFSVVDLIYAYDFGDSVQKDAFNAKINATAPLLQIDGRHYREFFVATCNNTDTAHLRLALEKLVAEAPQSSSDDSLIGFATALPMFRTDMRQARDLILQPLIDDLRQKTEIQDAVAHELRRPYGEEFQRIVAGESLRTAEIESTQSALENATRAIVELNTEKNRLEENATRAVAELNAEKNRLEELAVRLEGEIRMSTESEAAKTAELAHISQALSDLHRWMRRDPLVIVARILRRARRSAFHRLTGPSADDHDWLMAFRRSLAGRVVWSLLRKSARARRIAESVRPRPPAPVPAPAPAPAPAATPTAPIDESRDELRKTPPTNKGGSYTPPIGLLPWFDPLNIKVDRTLAMRPRLNVLVPGLAMKHMSGGPNTAISIAYRLAALGVPVRFVSTNAPIDDDSAPFWAHAQALAGSPNHIDNVEIFDASNRNVPLVIGENDLFMATAWWTAQMAKYAIRHTRHDRFVYLIQDYEPILHPASTQYALAEETYRLNFVPVVNSSLLAEFLISREVGRFSDPTFSRRTLVFEPAVDTEHFYFDAQATKPSPRRRLLFYARPTNGLRNLYELGVAALQKLLADGALNAAEWEFVGMGEKFEPVSLGYGGVLEPAPWLGFGAYAKQMRESDVLLSLMLSPHPSYPPLEMAACGKPVVTTCYANKTADRLAKISGNIIAVDATVESIAEGLVQAIKRSDMNAERQPETFGLPETWDESLGSVIPQLRNALLELMGAPAQFGKDSGLAYPERVPGCERWPANAYEVIRYAQIADRRTRYMDADPELISFLTPVWNTDPTFVKALAESVFAQDCGTGFEWILLDNAPTRQDTNELLDELAAHPCVRLIRVEKNLGILGGLRTALEAANNRYVAPLDADDLISPDCVRVLTSALKSANYPALAYTDEDKCDDTSYRDPYYKPDWDPTLFVHSCYISHLCAIDRHLALELGAYTDPEPEGSHDWDTFMRFWLNGHTPHHIPEVLYTWRMHAQSTAGNIHSKSYIYSSQSHVIGKVFQRSAHPDWYRVELSPIFDGTPDWRIVRNRNASKPDIPTVLLDNGVASMFDNVTDKPIGNDAVLHLLRSIEQVRSPLVHLQSREVKIADDTWQHDAQMLFELFPDTAVVGGRFRLGHEIVSADIYFGYGNGFDSPNVGRNVADSGYFCQMWKPHSVSAVSAEHCVVRTALLREVLTALVGTNISLQKLGIWLGAAARRNNQRVVYTPFFFAEATYRPVAVEPEEAQAFREVFPDLIIDHATLSPRLDLTRPRAFMGTSVAIRESQERERQADIELPWGETFRSDLISRRFTSLQISATGKFALLTLLYSRSPAELFRKTADSVLNQSLPFSEWIILENGPIPDDVRVVLDGLTSSDSRIRSYRSEALGIVGGLRYCLERATADFIVPMDADDLLTMDALELMAEALGGPDKPSFAFSDEDIQYDDRLDNPLKRAEFDPVLNRADSYIWHACAFRRDRALALDVYGDKGAEFCHDWDSVTRFADAGERIAHIPHVLYHWRAHASSSSNSGTVNVGSINSVKHVLGRSISNQPNPDLYAVDVFPIDRGVEQYGIVRLPRAPLSIAGIRFGESNRDFLTAAASMNGLISWRLELEGEIDWANVTDEVGKLAEAYVLWIDARYRLAEASVWEAMRLFEMHPDVAIVSGRVLSQSNTVVASCEPQANLWSGRGMRREEPGPFALALKPQTAIRVPDGFFFCRRELLQSVLTGKHREIDVAYALANEANVRGLRIAYSPLIEATLP